MAARSPSDWTAAFLAQARSDAAAFAHLRDDAKLPACHALHHLQMATEKLAKAVALASGARLEDLVRDHRRLVRVLRGISRNRAIARRLGMSTRGLHAYVTGTLPVAQEVEALAPGVDQGANTEYPWLAGQEVVAPSRYAFPLERSLRRPHGRHLLRIMGILLDSFEDIFG